jgi:hypothetical protein
MARWTRHVGLFTLALVMVGIVTAVIFGRQLSVMQGQLDEMRVDSLIHESEVAGGIKVIGIGKRARLPRRTRPGAPCEGSPEVIDGAAEQAQPTALDLVACYPAAVL